MLTSGELRYIRKPPRPVSSLPSDWHRVQGSKRVYVVVRRASTEVLYLYLYLYCICIWRPQQNIDGTEVRLDRLTSLRKFYYIS